MLVMLQNLVELIINKRTLEMSIIIRWILKKKKKSGIDSQLQELNHRFSEHAMELLLAQL